MTPEFSTIIQTPNRMRIIAIVTGLFIGLPLCTYLFFSASTFFARASDEVPRDVSISHISKSSAVIVWHTDRETLSVVEYGLSPDELTLYGPELESKQDHEVELTLLTPGTTYYFQIRNKETIHDNAGVPWTFTTRTIDGEDPLEEVKGIMTELTPMITRTQVKESTTSALTCDVEDCNEAELLRKLGKGCSSADVIRCRNGGNTPTGSITPVPSAMYSTPIPTPTSVSILSNQCNLDYLQPIDNNCTKWRWSNIATKPPICMEAFDHYVFQCKSSSFPVKDSDIIYADMAFYIEPTSGVAPNSASLNITPPMGNTIYCQVSAVDEDGNTTPWRRAEKKCE